MIKDTEEKVFVKKEYKSWFNLAVGLAKGTYLINIKDESKKFEIYYREGKTIDEAIQKFLE